MLDRLKGVFGKKRKPSEKDIEEEKHAHGDYDSTHTTTTILASIPEK
jgi:hypothetical protein